MFKNQSAAANKEAVAVGNASLIIKREKIFDAVATRLGVI